MTSNPAVHVAMNASIAPIMGELGCSRVRNASASWGSASARPSPVRVGSRCRSWVVGLALLACSTFVHAWGAEGHRLIAQLAALQLTERASAGVSRLLSGEPAVTMSKAATWADEVRSRKTAGWHYVNMQSDDCTYERVRDCREGKCIVEALSKQVAILRSTKSDSERADALRWVIHLIGDIHQPLHAGLSWDKGGNNQQVRAFGRGTNLHSVWDSLLLRFREDGLDPLRLIAGSDEIASAEPPQPELWAAESCRIVRTPGFYPASRDVDQFYAKHWDAILVMQIQKAARRLASTLNETLR